jgi:outer membrane protein
LWVPVSGAEWCGGGKKVVAFIVNMRIDSYCVKTSKLKPTGRALVAGVVLMCGLVWRASGEGVTLEAALARAQAGHPDARVAALRVAGAEAMLVRARAAYQPKVRVQGGYAGTNQPVSVFGMALNQRSFGPDLDFNDVPTADNLGAGAAVTLPLYAGGGNRAGREAAEAVVRASGWGEVAVRQGLAREVTRAWLAVRKARAVSVAVEAEVKSMALHVETGRKREEAGVVLRAEVLDMEVRLAGAREELLRVRNGQVLARRALGVLMGLEDGEVEVVDAVPEMEVPRVDAVVRRAEVEAAASVVAAAAAKVRQAGAGRRPKVEAFGSAEHNRGARFGGDGSNFTVGVMAVWDVWDGGEVRGRVSGAEAALAEAEEEVRRARTAVNAEVARARLELREADERLEVSGRAVGLAEESVKLWRERFTGGQALAGQLMDAETALTGARVRRVEAEADRRMAVAGLRCALGMPVLTERR